MRVQLKLFVATARDYFYTAYKSESVSVLKTNLSIFFAPVLAFIFSLLFFFDFSSRTSNIPTIKFKRDKKACNYLIPSLFSVYPRF